MILQEQIQLKAENIRLTDEVNHLKQVVKLLEGLVEAPKEETEAEAINALAAADESQEKSEDRKATSYEEAVLAEANAALGVAKEIPTEVDEKENDGK